ncbi:MAG: InlB B-repeat-containing protein, partial [Bacteroidales bacterium]|nr:InlB B-repeat-containing protein [Bacteroidales bacterium]
TINPFVINPDDEKLKVTLDPDYNYIYDGTPKEPSVKVEYDGKEIPASEYTVSYENNVDAGSATVIISDNDGGNYTINGKDNFTINPFVINPDDEKLKVTLDPDYNYIYDGTPKEPTVKVEYDGKEIPATEYTVSYENNVDAGTATVIISDKDGGNYTINGKDDFNIIPVFMVTFYSDHGIAPGPLKNIVIGSKIEAPTEKLTANGYTFSGEWFADKEFKNKWNFSNDVVNSDLTLYAYWTCDTIYITAEHVDSDGVIIADASNDYFCEGKAVIDFTVQNGTPQNYSIEFNEELIPTQNGEIDGNHIEIDLPKSLNPGTYNGFMVLSSNDGKTSDRLPLKVVVKLPLYAIVTLYNDVAAVNDLAGKFSGYQWLENAIPISGADGHLLQYSFDKSSTYTAMLTFDDGSKYETCPLDMSRIVTSKSTALRVYPNPAQPSDEVTIEVSENYIPDADKHIFIYNLNGTLMKQISKPEEINKVQLPMGNYSGVYLQNGEKVPFKLIVK